MRVWIDQDLCTGDGLCTDHAPSVFTLLEDGIAYVKQHGRVLNDPGGSGSLAAVPPDVTRDVVHAAEDCPGECIFIELDTSDFASPTADTDTDTEAHAHARAHAGADIDSPSEP